VRSEGRAQLARLARLRRLRLVDCTSLDNSALDYVGRFCPRLEGLGIKGCTRVDAGERGAARGGLPPP